MVLQNVMSLNRKILAVKLLRAHLSILFYIALQQNTTR